jgi:DNA-binding GntR family transcriptional regulator
MSLREKIYQKIRDDITNGKLSPGERLLESKLAVEFKCSQSPVREALRQLASEGLLTFEENKGSTIRKLSIQEIDETYRILSVLESYAASQSTGRATKKDITYLRGLHNKLKIVAKKQDLGGWLQSNAEFHNFFSIHAQNQTLCQMLENLKLRIYPYRYITIRIPHHLEEYIRHHEGILKGYEANDGKMVAEYMKLHVETVRDVLIGYLNQFPGLK